MMLHFDGLNNMNFKKNMHLDTKVTKIRKRHYFDTCFKYVEEKLKEKVGALGAAAILHDMKQKGTHKKPLKLITIIPVFMLHLTMGRPINV